MKAMKNIHQMKSVENESWIDIPENLYKSEVPIKSKRIVIDRSNVEVLHQNAISKYYSTDRKEYWQGQIDALGDLLTQ